MILLDPYTLILLIGPSGAGKSYFAKNIFIPFLKERVKDEADVTLLSSAISRRRLINCPEEGKKEPWKYNKFACGTRPQAVNFLLKELEMRMEFPISNKYIIIDEMECIDKDYRSQFTQIAIKNNYNVMAFVFDYKEENLTEEELQNPYFKQELLPEMEKLRSHIYYDLGSIPYVKFERRPDRCDDIFEIPNDLYENYLDIMESHKVFIISDICGYWNEFEEILKITNCLELAKNYGVKIILNGNFIGSGRGNKKIINFIYDHIKEEYFYILFGINEFKLAYALLRDDTIPFPNIEDIYQDLKKNYKEKFLSIAKYTRPFILSPFFVCTPTVHLPQYITRRHHCDENEYYHEVFYLINHKRNFYDISTRKFGIHHDAKMYINYFFGDEDRKYVNEEENWIATNGGIEYGGSLICIETDSAKYKIHEVQSKKK